MSFPRFETKPQVSLAQAAAAVAEVIANPGEPPLAANKRARAAIAYAVKTGRLTRNDGRLFDAAEFEQWQRARAAKDQEAAQAKVKTAQAKRESAHMVIGDYIPDAVEANLRLAIAELRIKGLRQRLARYRQIDRQHNNSLRRARAAKQQSADW